MNASSSCDGSIRTGGRSGASSVVTRDVRAEHVAQQLRGPGDHLAQIDARGCELALAREREHLLGQLGAVAHRALDVGEVRQRGVIRADLALGELDGRERDREQVVEVVRDTRGESPDRVEAL